MRAADELPLIYDGSQFGLLILQDGDDFEAWPEAFDICHRAALAVSERVAFYAPGSEPWMVTIRFGGLDEGRLMNKEFRHKDYATNVLSFVNDEAPEEGDEERFVGDIFICAPVVRREAEEQHKNADEHLTHMVVHGLLHLAGYDHEDDAMAHEMETLEIDILAGMGLDNPYNEKEQ